MYQPVLGSFIARDPLPMLGGSDILYDNINLYLYAGSNPNVFIDPYGLRELHVLVYNAFYNDPLLNSIRELEKTKDVIVIKDALTIGDVITKLGKQLILCDCIAEIEFKGHGNADHIWISPNDINVLGENNVYKRIQANESNSLAANMISSENFSYIAKQLRDKFCFTENATVILSGCNVGLTAKDKDFSWVQDFSKVLNTKVYAAGGWMHVNDLYMHDRCFNSTKEDKILIGGINDSGSKVIGAEKIETPFRFGSRDKTGYSFYPNYVPREQRESVSAGLIQDILELKPIE